MKKEKINKWLSKNFLKIIFAIEFLIFYMLFLKSGVVGKIEFITFTGFACLIFLKMSELNYFGGN